MPRHRLLSLSWIAASLAAVALGAAVAAPSILGPGGGAAVREAFALLCHQLPDRSPHAHGAQWALCFRCTGLLGGGIAGLLSGPAFRRPVARALEAWPAGRWIVLALVPMALDWSLGVSGLWTNTSASRLLTGAALGLVAGWVLADALRAPTTHPLSSPTST